MRKDSRPNPATNAPPTGRSRTLFWLVAGGAAVLALGLLLPRASRKSTDGTQIQAPAAATADSDSTLAEGMRDRTSASRLLHSRGGGGSGQSPEVIVADKAADFARSRRDLVNEMATRFGVTIPPDVERFFEAAESGNWDEIKSIFTTLSAAKESSGDARDLDVLWPAVREAYGVALAAKAWPAQELLDYGRSILSSLRPGMVYVAGSDAARYIPTLLAETGGGERPLILPQNGLAEGNQIDYLGFLHGDRFATLSRDDAQTAFNSFVANTQKNGSGEPVDPAQPSGSAAISGLNEALLRLMMEKNPGSSFALEQGVPMEGLHADALPLGPILELRAGGAPEATVAARATETLNYWRDLAQRLDADGGVAPDGQSRSAYAQMAISQAGYFAGRNLPDEAEQAYRVAQQIAPASVDATGQLANFLSKNGRQKEAVQLLDDFGRQHEQHQYAAEQLRKAIIDSPPAP